jgi:hypothetical protein
LNQYHIRKHETWKGSVAFYGVGIISFTSDYYGYNLVFGAFGIYIS